MKVFCIIWARYLVSLVLFNLALADDPLPEFWPLSGQLVEAVQVSNESGLKEGERFTLLRIEDGRVLGTFGRQGTQWVDLDATDVIELSAAIQEGKVVKHAPSLVERLYTTLYQRKESGETNPMRYQELKDTQYLLFYFAAGLQSDHADVVDQLSEAYSAMQALAPGLELIMVQNDGMVFKNADAAKIRWPFMALHLSYAYSEALHLGQDVESASFVLTGSNGDILRRYNLRETTVEDIAKDALAAISK